MKKIVLAAFSATALLALSACGDEAAEEATDDAAAAADTAEEATDDAAAATEEAAE